MAHQNFFFFNYQMKVLAFADGAEVIVGTLGALVAAATDFSLAPVTDDSFVRLTRHT